MDINMSEITSKNCYKCDLETIIDNNSQHFWINLRDFEKNYRLIAADLSKQKA